MKLARMPWRRSSGIFWLVMDARCLPAVFSMFLHSNMVTAIILLLTTSTTAILLYFYVFSIINHRLDCDLDVS